jgi:Bax protein
MFKIKEILSTDRKVYIPLLFSISCIGFGVFLIITSIISTPSLKDNFNKNKITFSSKTIIKAAPKFIISEDLSIPRFIIREDLSIKDLSNNDKNNNKNNQSADQSLIYLDLETVAFNNETLIIDLQTLPNELQSITDVKAKKIKFIISILPIVVQENEKIRTNRKRLLAIKDFLILYKTLNKKDQRFLEHLAFKYNFNILNKHKIDIVNALLESVDIIPNSIVLAQAANESGWGTSRFAKEYNAFFGEYTFDTKYGVVPIYRDNGEKYLIRFFSTINESVGSYFNNLNTHSAYKDFRKTRKNLRKNNLALDPLTLVRYLKPYAKDNNYVKIIESIIKTNNLNQFDNIRIITRKS